MSHDSNATERPFGRELRDPSDEVPTTLATSIPCRGCGSIHAVAVELAQLEDGRRRAKLERVSCERARGWYMRSAEDA